ncbi:MAG: RAMP superfamily CRISPR-associated protein [Chloroflexus sp.]|uniref:RAMP superfamily CRISPR-associated protein n=1 Tax=Chloroflexus sp. TaxID=1904827 RepID=UPI003D0CA5D1
MIYDYFANVTKRLEENLKHYDCSLCELENKRQGQKQKRKEISRQIEQVKQKLRDHWKGEAKGDQSRVLATQIADDTAVWWFKELPRKEDARTEVYIPIAKGLTIKVGDCLDFHPNFSSLPSATWLALQVDFELLTPWYSKDDRVFHVMDNPVRKDRVFGVPFMAASSWKGMLRWAFRMHTKLIGPEKESDEEKRKQAQAWELHLFGNEKGEEDHEKLHQGALVFYPTWFDRIGFEVINPHSRERRAGTQPIYYEVVPPGGKGTLSLLYAPWPGMKPAATPQDVIPKLLEAVEDLLTNYGISAKRTVGWGTAKITEWRAFHKTHVSIQKNSRNGLWQGIQSWLP